MKRKPIKRHARTRPKPPKSALGEAIRRARTTKGLTQLALAHALGYEGDDAGAYISRVESGHQSPRIETLSRIADALGVTVCALLP
jgi:transcriptional regulator with XRE-family HTH domain